MSPKRAAHQGKQEREKGIEDDAGVCPDRRSPKWLNGRDRASVKGPDGGAQRKAGRGDGFARAPILAATGAFKTIGTKKQVKTLSEWGKKRRAHRWTA